MDAYHWLTWLPAIFFAIPFLFFFGVVPSMALVREMKRRRTLDE